MDLFKAEIGSEIIPGTFGLILCTFITTYKDVKIIQGWLRIKGRAGFLKEILEKLKFLNLWNGCAYGPISLN